MFAKKILIRTNIFSDRVDKKNISVFHKLLSFFEVHYDLFGDIFFELIMDIQIHIFYSCSEIYEIKLWN